MTSFQDYFNNVDFSCKEEEEEFEQNIQTFAICQISDKNFDFSSQEELNIEYNKMKYFYFVTILFHKIATNIYVQLCSFLNYLFFKVFNLDI